MIIDTRKGVDSIAGYSPYNLYRTPTRGCLSIEMEVTRLSLRKDENTAFVIHYPRIIVFSR